MYQPYAAGGQPATPQQPPKSVLTAVKLMYVGAALEVVGLILNLISMGSTSSNVFFSLIIPLIGAGLWIWMAMSNRAGKSWARIVATVFFGISCLFLLLFLLGIAALMALLGGAMVGVGLLLIVVTVGGWLIGLFTIILLWRPESSAYFTAMSAQPGMPPAAPPSMPPPVS